VFASPCIEKEESCSRLNQKNREEFYEILEDIGMVTNKHEDFVLVNDSDSGIIMLGCEQNLNFFVVT
jgi:hypothetical protein